MIHQAMIFIILKEAAALQPGWITPLNLQRAQMQTGGQFWTGEENFTRMLIVQK